MEQTRNELLLGHRKVENDSGDLSSLPWYYTQTAPKAAIAKSRISPLEEALKLTTGERQSTYGHPLEDYTRTAALWTSLLGLPSGTITPERAVMMMVCLKLSREIHQHKQDNLIDAAGYVNCLDMIIKAKEL